MRNQHDLLCVSVNIKAGEGAVSVELKYPGDTGGAFEHAGLSSPGKARQENMNKFSVWSPAKR